MLVPSILCVAFRLVNQNKQKPGHKRENVRLLISFVKAFINQFLRIILSSCYWEFSLIKFHIGADIRPKKAQSENHCKYFNSELLPNVYYSPIKKLENIFIFKIARQQHPQQKQVKSDCIRLRRKKEIIKNQLKTYLFELQIDKNLNKHCMIQDEVKSISLTQILDHQLPGLVYNFNKTTFIGSKLTSL